MKVRTGMVCGMCHSGHGEGGAFGEHGYIVKVEACFSVNGLVHQLVPSTTCGEVVDTETKRSVSGPNHGFADGRTSAWQIGQL